ncbi:MAG: hypothetical protein ABSF32_00485 [Ignavibacteria bacterium]|jgi:hypothetical protein
MLEMIINALVSADEMHKKIALGKLKYTGLNLELGLPPKVVIKFAGYTAGYRCKNSHI